MPDRRRRLLLLTLLPLFCIFYDTSSRAIAAEVASTGVTDEARCASTGYKIGSNYGSLSKCYVKTTFGALSGTTVVDSTFSATNFVQSKWYITPAAIWTTTGSGSGRCGSVSGGDHKLTIFYGPQTTTRFGVIPANAAVFDVACSVLGTTYNGNGWLDAQIPAVAYTCEGTQGAIDLTGDVGDPDSRKITCASWGGIKATQTLADEIAWPPDWFTGGAEAGVSPFCGADVTSNLDDDAFVEDGDPISFTTDWTSGKTGNVDVRFSETGPWVPIFTEGTITNPYTREIIADVPYPFVARVGNLGLRCRDIALNTFYYQSVEVDGNPTEDGRATRPCSLARFYWPAQQTVTAFQTLDWRLDYSGLLPVGYSPSTLSVEYATYDEDEAIPALTSLTWLPWAGPLDKPQTNYTADATAGFDGSVSQFVFRCTDATGTMYSGQWSSAVRVSPSSDLDVANRDAACISSAGLKLNPSSWVPGILKMGSCMLKALFIPDQSTLDGAQESVGAELAQRTPTNFASEAVPMVAGTFFDLDDSIQANHDSCFTLLPSMGPDIIPNGGEIDSQGMCGEDIAQLDSWRPIAAFFFWISFAFSMFRLVGRVLDGADLTGAVGSYFRSTDVGDDEGAPQGFRMSHYNG